MKNLKSHYLVLSVFILAFTSCQNTEISRPPIMGWASWNQYGANINDSIIKAQADAMDTSGLKAAGFKYINIDDGFFDGRNDAGALNIDKIKFPEGMKSLADYIHSKGLKAGFYSEAGENTCGSLWSNQPGGIEGGLYGHDQQDIDTIFKSWDYDFLKVDFCGGKELGLDEETRYTAIRQAMDNTGRKDINYNICRWEFPGVWVTKVADSWRISHDINFHPGSVPSWNSILSIIDINTYLAAYASPGHYNDMDMLEVGRGMNYNEDKSHFSMWCIMSSPLLLGNDMAKMSAETRDILTNSEVIAVNQDPAGLQAHLISDKGGLQVWAKPLKDRISRERAIVLFNRTEQPASIGVKWTELGLKGTVQVRDLWTKRDLGIMKDGCNAIVAPHGVVMLKVKADGRVQQKVYEAEYAWVNEFNHLKDSKKVQRVGTIAKDSLFSGGAKVSWLGNSADNYIEFPYVYVDQTGKYTLTIYYVCSENRNAVLTVNGEEIMLTKLNSKTWSNINQVDVPVTLKKGYNEIKISNSNSWMPDIDKIEIN